MRDCILITGGAGFIGHHLVKHFQERHTGLEVAVLDRFDQFSVVKQFPSDVTVLIHDLQHPIKDAGPLGAIADRIRYVVHAAAGSHVDRSIVDPVGFVSDNVLGTVHLLEYVRNYLRPDKTLIFSTDEVVGPANPGDEFGEFARTNPANPYAASKAGAESVAVAYANTYAMPIVISRCSNVYGPGQHAEKFIPLCIDRIMRGQPVQIHARNGIVCTRLYLHVADVCRAVEQILEHGDVLKIHARCGRYNIAGLQEYSNLEVAKQIALELEKDLIYELVDYVPHRPAFDLRYRISCDRLHQLGWAPRINLETGLRSVCRKALEAA
jgi:dTDP-glucose 4,6-dehydratase